MREFSARPLGQITSSTVLYEGRYRIDITLAVAPNRAVYRAWDLFYGRPATIIELATPTVQRGPAALERAVPLVQLDHPAFTPFQLVFVEKGTVFLGLGIAGGQTIASIMAERHAPITPTAAVRWIAQAAENLEFLSKELPTWHLGDISPSALLVTAEDRIQLLSFEVPLGLLTPEDVSATLPRGDVAPELARGVCDERSDVYSLAATLHYLLTGRRWTLDATDAIQRLRDELPRQLAATVARGLEENPLLRWSDPARFYQELLRALPADRPALSNPSSWEMYDDTFAGLNEEPPTLITTRDQMNTALQAEGARVAAENIAQVPAMAATDTSAMPQPDVATIPTIPQPHAAETPQPDVADMPTIPQSHATDTPAPDDASVALDTPEVVANMESAPELGAPTLHRDEGVHHALPLIIAPPDWHHAGNGTRDAAQSDAENALTPEVSSTANPLAEDAAKSAAPMISPMYEDYSDMMDEEWEWPSRSNGSSNQAQVQEQPMSVSEYDADSATTADDRATGNEMQLADLIAPDTQPRVEATPSIIEATPNTEAQPSPNETLIRWPSAVLHVPAIAAETASAEQEEQAPASGESVESTANGADDVAQPLPWYSYMGWPELIPPTLPQEQLDSDAADDRSLETLPATAGTDQHVSMPENDVAAHTVGGEDAAAHAIGSEDVAAYGVSGEDATTAPWYHDASDAVPAEAVTVPPYDAPPERFPWASILATETTAEPEAAPNASQETAAPPAESETPTIRRVTDEWPPEQPTYAPLLPTIRPLTTEYDHSTTSDAAQGMSAISGGWQEHEQFISAHPEGTESSGGWQPANERATIPESKSSKTPSRPLGSGLLDKLRTLLQSPASQPAQATGTIVVPRHMYPQHTYSVLVRLQCRPATTPEATTTSRPHDAFILVEIESTTDAYYVPVRRLALRLPPDGGLSEGTFTITALRASLPSGTDPITFSFRSVQGGILHEGQFLADVSILSPQQITSGNPMITLVHALDIPGVTS